MLDTFENACRKMERDADGLTFYDKQEAYERKVWDALPWHAKLSSKLAKTLRVLMRL